MSETLVDPILAALQAENAKLRALLADTAEERDDALRVLKAIACRGHAPGCENRRWVPLDVCGCTPSGEQQAADELQRIRRERRHAKSKRKTRSLA